MAKKSFNHICQTLNLSRVCKIGKFFLCQSLQRVPEILEFFQSGSIKPLKKPKPTFTTTYTQSTDTTTLHKATDIQKNSKRNTIQLLAKEAVKGSKAPDYYLYTDNNGRQTYLSAHPEGDSPLRGKIITETKTYSSETPNFVDLVSIGTISGNAKEIARTFQGLKAEFARIEQADISHNSCSNRFDVNDNNAVATAALHDDVFNSQIQTQNGKGPRNDIDLNLRAPGQATQVELTASSKNQEKGTEKNSDSATIQQHKSILAMYSADVTANGKIDVSKMIRELQTAKYSKEDITAVLNTMYEIQNLPEAHRSQLAATAIESANKTTVASATPTVNRQATL